MSLSKLSHRHSALVLSACAAAAIAAFLLLRKGDRSKKKSRGFAIASLNDLITYQHNFAKRTFFGPFITTVKLHGFPAVERPLLARALPWFSRVSVLDLSSNALIDIPTTVWGLAGLRSLNLSKNKIASIPSGVSGLVKLQELDLSRNELESVPEDLCLLSSLRTLNLMNNQLTALPQGLGKLTSVFRLGLKSNKLRSLPDSIGDMQSLVELFITDNELTALPASMGKLAKLVKLQASFNHLESLPPEMGQLPSLELFRVAVNRIPEVPASFQSLSKLAWFSLAGNPACALLPEPRPGLPTIPFESLRVGEKLGDGASGDVYAAVLSGEDHDVVFKQFKAETSPDGHCRDETAITASLDHPNLTRVLGTVAHPQGMVLERVYARSMAEKPNFDSLLRCRWDPSLKFSLDFVLAVAKGIASALGYLHQRGICHGDVYAHNILTTQSGHATLCDFGAAFCYSKESSVPFEAQEVRAFGLFLNDLQSRVTQLASQKQHSKAEELEALVRRCIESGAMERPSFKDVVLMLDALSN